MNNLDAMFMDCLLDVKLTIYSFDRNGSRWILNRYVRDSVIKLFLIADIAVTFGFLTEHESDRIHYMVVASCDRMLSDLDAEG